MRDLNNEFQDTVDRKYAYNFDYRMHAYMLRTFEPFLQNATHALEMGCYVGEFTKILAKRFSQVTVLEGSEDLIQKAKVNVSSSNVAFVHGQFERASFDKKFDAIFLIHTLEHLDNPQEILSKINNWLTPKGLLFVVVPNARALSRQIAVKMGLITHNSAVTEAEYKHGHRKTYTLDTLQLEVEAAGLAVRRTGGVFVKPMANFQIDKAVELGVISESYLEGCYQLGDLYPDLCSSIYMICGSTAEKGSLS